MTEAETVPLLAQLAPFASVFAAIIASSSALWIATKIYRVQKKIDVQIKRSEEKRQAFKDYFCSATNMHTELRAALYRGLDQNGHFLTAEKRLHELYRDQEALAFSVSKESADSCREYTLALLGLREFVSKDIFGTDITAVYSHLEDCEDAILDVLKYREAALVRARADVLETPIETARSDLKNLLSQRHQRGELNIKTEKMRALRADLSTSEAESGKAS